MIIDEEDYIQHFGVKGMKWGIRHDPKALAAKREKKAQKFVAKANVHQKRIDAALASNSPFKYRTVMNQRKKQLKDLQTAKAKREGNLTERQRKLAIAGSSAAATAAAYGTYQSLNSGNARRLVRKGKAAITGEDTSNPWKSKPDLARPMSIDQLHSEVVSPINPDYGEPGTKMNCRRATYAYEMRRRGNDVMATRTTNGRGQEITGDYNAQNPGVNLVPPGKSGMLYRVYSEARKDEMPFVNYVNERVETGATLGANPIEPTRIFSELKKNPPGSRGELGIMWTTGGGHSMAWENVDGKVVVFDNQTGERYTKMSDFDSLPLDMAETASTRLDDKPLNDDFLMRWLKDA